MKEIAKEIEGIWTSYKSLARKRQDTEAVLQCALADPAADLAALREALQAMLHAYDIGQSASDGSAIALARAALARTERRPA